MTSPDWPITMTEAALDLAERIRDWQTAEWVGAKEIDALCEQRVSAAVRRICPNALHVGPYHASCDYPDCRDDSQCKFWKKVDGVEAPAERPAPPIPELSVVRLAESVEGISVGTKGTVVRVYPGSALAETGYRVQFSFGAVTVARSQIELVERPAPEGPQQGG